MFVFRSKSTTTLPSGTTATPSQTNVSGRTQTAAPSAKRYFNMHKKGESNISDESYMNGSQSESRASAPSSPFQPPFHSTPSSRLPQSDRNLRNVTRINSHVRLVTRGAYHKRELAII